jgi:hypothetical protein
MMPLSRGRSFLTVNSLQGAQLSKSNHPLLEGVGRRSDAAGSRALGFVWKARIASEEPREIIR